MIWPQRKCSSGLPVLRSNLRIGSAFDVAHALAPRLSYAQTLPSGPMSTPAVEPHIRPSGSSPQFFTIVGLGLGSGFLAGSSTSCVDALTLQNPATARPAKSMARTVLEALMTALLQIIRQSSCA